MDVELKGRKVYGFGSRTPPPPPRLPAQTHLIYELVRVSAILFRVSRAIYMCVCVYIYVYICVYMYI